MLKQLLFCRKTYYLVPFTTAKGFRSLFSNSNGLHFGFLVETDTLVAWDLDVLFKCVAKLPGAVSVPNKGYVAEFDSFTAKMEKNITFSSHSAVFA